MAGRKPAGPSTLRAARIAVMREVIATDSPNAGQELQRFTRVLFGVHPELRRLPKRIVTRWRFRVP